jgi:hypothetical protein
MSRPADDPRAYKILSCVSAALFFALFAALLLSPRSVLAGAGLVATDWTDFVSRRAGVIMLGLAVLCFQSRNAPHGATQAVLMGMGTVFGALAVLGSAEVLRGFAKGGLLPAVALEATLAVLYFALWIRGRGVESVEGGAEHAPSSAGTADR